ncbi:MAG: metal ABC transporter ATP-binding protein [Coriobacteriia bacterium]|nr:metal ABC transporter ATP-binding protein [Coriobacteriia bacterium]
MKKASYIACKDASFSYEGTTVVSGIDFELERGDYLCVVGENGSGKSTLVHGLLGLKQPCTGEIQRAEELCKGAVGYLPQQRALQRSFPTSVMEVVLSGRLSSKGFFSFYNKHDRSLACEVLEKLEISSLASCVFGELSGGQQQRVLLARALVAASDGLKLLILDEPMNGLDPHSKQELYELIAKLNKEGLTLVMVTHDVNAAVSAANKILLLDSKQEFFGSTHDFQHTARGRDLMRDSCGGHCAVCGLAVHDHD